MELELKDYRQEETGAVYQDAELFASDPSRITSRQSREYWAAWFAARRASEALLAEAKAMGLTKVQWERLRKVAAHVAAD